MGANNWQDEQNCLCMRQTNQLPHVDNLIITGRKTKGDMFDGPFVKSIMP